MEGLLHWDFNPGLALAEQVRRRFGETVHFSPSCKTKEFFLVVSFSSASFPLNEESVGVALQCCIGGHHLGFKVSKIFEKSFRFSVVGNKVGHFIHGLKDHTWPDFICSMVVSVGTSIWILVGMQMKGWTLLLVGAPWLCALPHQFSHSPLDLIIQPPKSYANLARSYSFHGFQRHEQS
ncbi:hypothetical protein CFC21_005632 [Triticum aestivum]|uniref:Uncharacterized protein n=2 Tax=Triticum aestivum TaxID=4565 RepID=A0A9R1DA22_WHEAT|nr:hypothetical protein CFC21_005632 [Triticum aestivum]